MAAYGWPQPTKIVVLGGGRVVETGRHHDLLAQGGRYADLWNERIRTPGWRCASPDSMLTGRKIGSDRHWTGKALPETAQ